MKKTRHIDVRGENFVRQNHILCIIYTQMCVIRNTNIINRLPAINCRPQHPTLTVMLHFPQQLTGQHDEVNCVIIGHVAIDHALEQTGGCQDIAAFTGQCLAHQQVPLPTGMYNMYNGASMKTERATLICNIHTRNMQLYTVCNPANMYTQHVTLSVCTHSMWSCQYVHTACDPVNMYTQRVTLPLCTIQIYCPHGEIPLAATAMNTVKN